MKKIKMEDQDSSSQTVESGSKLKGEPVETDHLKKTQMGRPPALNSTENLVWFMERSPLFMNSVLGFAARLLFEIKNQVNGEIEQFEKSSGEMD